MYRLTAEQQRVVQQVATLADQQIAPHAARVDRDGAFPREAIAALGDGGCARPDRPAGVRRHGPGPPDDGRGAGRGGAAMLVDRDGVSDAPVRRRLLRRRARTRREPYLRAAARGRHLSTLAFSERGSRSHFWAPVSRAVAGNGARAHQRAEVVRDVGGPRRRLRRCRRSAADATQPVESTIYLVLRDDRRRERLRRLARPRHAWQRQRADDARERDGRRRIARSPRRARAST